MSHSTTNYHTTVSYSGSDATKLSELPLDKNSSSNSGELHEFSLKVVFDSYGCVRDVRDNGLS